MSAKCQSRHASAWSHVLRLALTCGRVLPDEAIVAAGLPQLLRDSREEVNHMKRMIQLLCGVTIMVMAGVATTNVYAQSTGTQSFFAYKEGVTPEQEAEDHAACHDWAVAQSGFQPSAAYATGRSLIAGAGNTLPSDDRRYPAPTGIAGAVGTAEVERLNRLYADYLRAGRVCLEGRGYVTSR